MNYSLFQPINHSVPLGLGIRGDAGAYRDTMELTFFLQILLIYLCFSVKVIIFVELLPYRKVVELFDVRFDRGI